MEKKTLKKAKQKCYASSPGDHSRIVQAHISNISKCLVGMGESYSAGGQEGGSGADFSVGGEGQELSSCSLGFRQDLSVGKDKEGCVNQNHSPCVSIGSGVDFSLGRDEGRLVHQDHSPSVSLSSGLDEGECDLGSLLDFSSGLEMRETVKQCSGEEVGDGCLVEAVKIKSTSYSTGNFAVKLVQRFFTQD